MAEQSVDLTKATDLELAKYLNEFHGRLRDAESGLMAINAEINKRQVEANKTNDEGE
jgi:hypothetical protein